MWTSPLTHEAWAPPDIRYATPAIWYPPSKKRLTRRASLWLTLLQIPTSSAHQPASPSWRGVGRASPLAGVRDLRSFGHRSRTKQMGYATEDYRGKPVIGIINTWSDINPCHTHFRERAEEVKRGVWQ